MTRYVLDSYAMLAYYWREPGWEIVSGILREPRNKLWMSVINRGEVYYRVARAENALLAQTATQWMEQLVISMPVDWEDTLEAAKIKSAFALSYADCFAAALARRMKARVVTGDPEFAKIEKANVAQIEWLPPHRRRR